MGIGEILTRINLQSYFNSKKDMSSIHNHYRYNYSKVRNNNNNHNNNNNTII